MTIDITYVIQTFHMYRLTKILIGINRMKLYEFTVTDEHNLPKYKILEIAEMSAADEAPLREWGDFKVVECLTPEQLPSGETRYSFQVEGEYANSVNSRDNMQTSSATVRINHGSAAAPEL